MAVTERWFTYEQVAERYGVTRMTVFRWAKSGLLRAKKIGGKVYFTESALRTFERRKTV